MVFDVAGPVRLGRVQVALELGEDLAVRLADDVGQHVEAATVRHADDDLVEAVLGALVDRRVHHRDDGLGALEGEPLLADVLGLQERLERLGGVELAQDVLLLGDRRLLVLDLDALLEPLLLLGLEDVGVLHPDVAAVRVAQQAQDVAQLLLLLPGEAVDLELPVQVPQGQAVGVDVEVGVAAEAGVVQPQRVDVGHEMTAVAVGRDQLDDAGTLVLDGIRVVDAPPHRLVGNPQLTEDLVVEIVVEQQLMDRSQEVTRLRALDDPVIVGRGQRHQFADADLIDPVLAGALELGGVLHRAGADDRALTLHQPRHRVDGADGAGVGQRDRHAGEVLSGELAVAGSAHDVLVGRDELAERHRLAVLDRRDHQRALTALAGQVDGQPQIGVGGRDRVGLAVDHREVPVHVGELLDRLHDRVAQQVGERDLAAPGPLEVVVDDDAVVDHRLGRDGAHARGGRHLQRGGHVLGDRGSRPPQHLVLVLAGGGLALRRLSLGGRRAVLLGVFLLGRGLGFGVGLGVGLALGLGLGL